MLYGAHTDYTGFTLRPDPEIIGLEAQAADGVDFGAAAARRATSSTLAICCRWTNDRWRSAPHRSQPAARSAPRRGLLVFFTGPADDTVEPLPNCHGPEAPKKYEPVSAREHLPQVGRSTDVLKDLKL